VDGPERSVSLFQDISRNQLYGVDFATNQPGPAFNCCELLGIEADQSKLSRRDNVSDQINCLQWGYTVASEPTRAKAATPKWQLKYMDNQSN